MNIVVATMAASRASAPPRRMVDHLVATFPEHRFVTAADDEELGHALPDVDVAFTAWIDPRMVSTLTRLRWIQAPLVGVNQLMSPELVASDVVVTNARGIRARAVAEHVLAVLFALARRLDVAIRGQ